MACILINVGMTLIAYLHLSKCVGVSYFVYGEKINVYSGADPTQQEFIDAGLEYIRSLVSITTALPLYKLYPTKAYKDYEKTVRRMQRAGMACIFMQNIDIIVLLIGRQILQRQSEYINEAVAAGIVDETKAVGKNLSHAIFVNNTSVIYDIGLLNQWLIEGKFTEEEALSQSYDMLSAGIDTVRGHENLVW